VSLRRLLARPGDPDTEIARCWEPAAQADRVIRFAELRRDVAALRARLEGEPDGAWVLLTEDAYAFAVGLLALWHSGRHAISPPNRQPGSLRALQTRAAGVLSDRADWLGEGACLHPLLDGIPGADPALLSELDPDALAVELYTSGTTGGEKPVVKRIRHLDDEVTGLRQIWDERVRGSVFFSTASHQHLYGLLFGVLWPLASGHSFQSHHFLHAGEAVPRMRELGDCVLASVPTTLRRLGRHASVSTLRGVCRTVFSSGGPLPRETAHEIAGLLGHAPLEVLGSTETGGIAWRAQEPDASEPPWTPFSGVAVSSDAELGVLRVRSPFVSIDGGDEGFATNDRVELLPDGRFSLRGRADRVVKVGEKRLDLGRMESQLLGHAFVDEIALTTVERSGAPRVAAAVVPSERGWAAIASGGRFAFGRALRAELGADWDPVLHPRHWRMVQQLPENSQGKVTRGALAQLFGAQAAALPASDRPEVLEEFRGPDFVERSCRVPTDLVCLPGHFPGAPVVPGVLQLDWALEMAASLYGRAPRVIELESLKFLVTLRPGDAFRIQIRAVDEDRLELRAWGEAGEHAWGRVLIERMVSGEEPSADGGST
jgi:acyl-coenzyme A synthetase/AMP-(fatty) acid ligase